MKESEELQLQIDQAKVGKQSAFNYLLNLYWSDVYNFQKSRTQNEYDAEDITIRSFSKAFDKIHQYDSQYTFKTWLITISKNLHIDMIRKRKTSISSQSAPDTLTAVQRIPDDQPTAEDTLIIKQNLDRLLQDIKKLKPHYQEVINLRFFQELSYKEMTVAMNEPINNVKVKLLRAKKLLAEILEGSNNG